MPPSGQCGLLGRRLGWGANRSRPESWSLLAFSRQITREDRALQLPLDRHVARSTCGARADEGIGLARGFGPVFDSLPFDIPHDTWLLLHFRDAGATIAAGVFVFAFASGWPATGTLAVRVIGTASGGGSFPPARSVFRRRAWWGEELVKACRAGPSSGTASARLLSTKNLTIPRCITPLLDIPLL